ncbi:MAG TPA: carboxypeptidase-like regulatory domain-containing protein, partial [Myxococcales bacterium]|nr:carboxypeptidase-like regulatory domain-containing protein [Myxococcales bacterium]
MAAALRILAAQEPVPAQRPARPPACEVSGTATAGNARLPGVAITISPDGGAPPIVTSTGLDGRYGAAIPGPGSYTVRAELAAFAPAVRQVTVDASCRARLDLALTLASRVQGAPLAAQPVRVGPPNRGAARVGQFQRVGPASGGARAASQAPGMQQGEPTAEDDAAIASHLSLPPGFSPEALSEPVAAFGGTGQTNEALLA